jgi:urease accessory protein
MLNKRSSVAFLIAALCATQSAFAHPGHHFQGVAGGMAHPLGGIDHLLTMIAVGLWAAQLGGRALWMVPCAFVALMAGGGALGMTGLHLPLLESGIAVSVLVLGLMIATATKAPLYASVTLVGLFALFHGVAHGAELPADASALSYSAGFVLATAALHGVGMGLGLLAKNLMSSRVLFRTAGAAISLCGLLLLAGVIRG